MNYFAHAIRYLNRPHFMAGLAVPDWLSVVDRSVRVRSRSIEKHRDSFAGDDAEIAAGIQQHLDDDHWFHATPAFYTVTGQVAALFRRSLESHSGSTADEEVWPYGFLGHLLTELLIDAALAELFPQLLHRYYENIETVMGERVARVVEQLTAKPVPLLPHFMMLYHRERFLFDYLDDDRLLRRVNQVLRRVKVDPLPTSTVETLAQARIVVSSELTGLLPADRFGALDRLRCG